MDRKEIERKWVLSEVPGDVPNDSTQTIYQAYVIANENEMRVRQIGDDKFYLTVKSGDDRIRDEWEIEIPQWVFEAITISCESIKENILKQRTIILHGTPHGKHTLEIDVFHGALEGLVIMECEFESEEEADRFEVPSWIGNTIEVTNDPRFENKALALNMKIPEIQ